MNIFLTKTQFKISKYENTKYIIILEQEFLPFHVWYKYVQLYNKKIENQRIQIVVSKKHEQRFTNHQPYE